MNAIFRTPSLLLTVTIGVFSMALQSADALTVAWSTPHVAINSNSDIVNSGNVIHAVNFGNAGSNIDVAVGGNTVTFDPSGVVGGTGFFNTGFFVDDNPAPGSVGADFESVLDSFRDNGDASYTFTGLSAGTYTLQVFHSDDRSNRAVQWNVDGTNVSFTNGTATFRSSYLLAEVTLAAGETSFTLQRTQGQINAAVLSQVPEPSSLAFLVLSASLVAVRRKR